LKKTAPTKLTLRRETLAALIEISSHGALSGTLTYEGSCGPTTCPCPHGGSEL
jgi:hypothetical protein